MAEHTKPPKIRRKDLRQPDEFETLTGQALDFARTHRTAVVTVTGVLVAVGVAAVAFAQWRASQSEAAAVAFWGAHEAFAAKRFDEAVRAFAELADKYPGTPSGRLAPLYRAHAMARQGDNAAAATGYAEYLARGPETPYLRQEALLDLGHTKEAGGDAAGALDVFTQAGAIEGPFKREALLAAAHVQEAAGRAAEAQAIYAQLLEESPDPELRAFLVGKLPPGSAEGSPTAQAVDVR